MTSNNWENCDYWLWPSWYTYATWAVVVIVLIALAFGEILWNN